MNNFYGMLARMKYINRWGLMRTVDSENIAEHSLEVSIIAHALAVIGNTYFGKDLDPEHIAVMGIMHDTAEIITGDMPTLRHIACFLFDRRGRKWERYWS